MGKFAKNPKICTEKNFVRDQQRHILQEPKMKVP